MSLCTAQYSIVEHYSCSKLMFVMPHIMKLVFLLIIRTEFALVDEYWVDAKWLVIFKQGAFVNAYI